LWQHLSGETAPGAAAAAAADLHEQQWAAATAQVYTNFNNVSIDILAEGVAQLHMS
jgi:hypothetical protein